MFTRKYDRLKNVEILDCQKIILTFNKIIANY